MYSNKYDVIRGRFTKEAFVLLKKLGAGGIGDIYLVSSPSGERVALKISKDLVSITKEFNYLKKLAHKDFIPKVYELDDYSRAGEIYHFFTMEYIEGQNLKKALKNTKVPLKVKTDLVCIITKMIKEINDEGYIYSDLKLENIMVDKLNHKVRLIDLGSLVEIGDTVKEFTPMYDRTAWGVGRRVADKGYQTFSIGMVLVSLLLGTNLNPDREKLGSVLERVKKNRQAGGLYKIIIGCVSGRIDDCGRLFQEIRRFSAAKHQNKLSVALNIMIAALLAAVIAMLFIIS